MRPGYRTKSSRGSPRSLPLRQRFGTQLTLGGVSDTLIVTRPAGKTLEQDEIHALSAHTATMVFFLGADRIEEIVAKLQYPPSTPAAVIYHASWPDQKIVRGTLADIAGKASEAGITQIGAAPGRRRPRPLRIRPQEVGALLMNRAVIYLPRFSEAAGRVASVLGADLVEYSPTAFADTVARCREIAAVMSVGIAVRGIAPHLKDKWRDPALVVVTPDLRLAIPVTGGHHGANAMARELAPLGTVPVITTATERAGVPSVEGIAAAGGYALVNHDASKYVNAAFLDGTAGIYAVKGPAVVIGGTDTAFLIADGEYSVGIGCRKDTAAGEVEAAVRAVLGRLGISPDQVLVYATTAKKSQESGILDAVRALGAPGPLP